MEFNDLLTKNIKYGESWSTKVISDIEISRQTPPAEEYLPDVIITAEDGQVIRDTLNKVYGGNPKIGNRNKLNEIMLLIGSFWRSEVFQIYLFKTKQSTTTTGDHPKGKAIDLWTPRGLTPRQFYWFIKYKCKTRFTKFIIYGWGVHCARK